MRPALVILLALVLPQPVRAACRVAADAVEFGVVEVTRDSHGTGRLTVTCDGATGFRIGIEGSGGRLQLEGPGGARLDYRLYSDPGHKTAFDGEGVPGATEGEKPARVTVYGRIPRQRAVPEGTYSGRVVVTLSF